MSTVSDLTTTSAPIARLGLLVPIVGGPRHGPALTSLGEVLELADAAEGSGFDSLWVPDHPHAAAAAPHGALEAYTVLGALAARTTTVRLAAVGPSAVARGPGIVVKQVTAIDVVSGGRAILGLAPQPWVGYSSRGGEKQALADRVARLGEALEVCRALLDPTTTADGAASAAAAATYDGHYYFLSGAVNRPPPVQGGGIPIVVPVSGADADRGVIDLAVRHASACMIGGGDPHLQATVDDLRRRCAASGRDPATLPVLHVGPVTTAERLAAVRALGVDGVVVTVDEDDDVEEIGRTLRAGSG